MELTPMMQQYRATKEQHPDEILFFRLGDFYEMFFEDAKTASRELGLTLTSRSGDVAKAPMCGIPYHAAESYIDKLINKGYKISYPNVNKSQKQFSIFENEIVFKMTLLFCKFLYRYK